MEPKEATGKENMVTKKKNLAFLRSRLYMLERRKTDSVVDSSVSGDHSGTLRRSQSDRTEYNQKLQGNQKEINCPSYCTPCSISATFPFAKKTHKAEEKIKYHLSFPQNKKMKVNVTCKL